jgi:hypothetical protein
MNYYLIKKEEKVNIISILANNHKEILHKLDEIESRVGIENIISFYDELIEIIKMNIKIEVNDLDNYYKLFSDTLHFSYMRLSDAYRCLASDIGKSANQLYKLCPWYQRLWYRVKKIF